MPLGPFGAARPENVVELEPARLDELPERLEARLHRPPSQRAIWARSLPTRAPSSPWERPASGRASRMSKPLVTSPILSSGCNPPTERLCYVVHEGGAVQLTLELPGGHPPTPARTSSRSRAPEASLDAGQAARIIREAVKDKSYRSTPLGQLVGRYMRWFRNEYGATESTLRDYEAVLARMSLTLADKEPIDVSIEDLRDVI